MQHLPEPEEQRWILDGLASLIRRGGLAPFVSAPIVETNRRHFPEGYSPTLPSVDRLGRRLMQYAGLGDLDVALAPFEPHEVDDESVLADFRGIEKGVATFGLNVEQVADLEPIAGVLAHEVAHAFRQRRGLVVDDPDEEELLTDLTTIYLGFGILTANARWRFRKGGELQGAYAVTRWVTTAAGYLPAQGFSFALTAQLVARDPAPREWKRVLAALETNQRAFAEAALEKLAADRERLTTALALPDRTGWPPPVAPDSILRPLPPPPEFEEWGDTEEDTTWNAGHPVFRVRESHVVLSTVLPGLIFGIGGMALTGVLWGSQSGFWAGAAGAAIGLRTGLKGRCDVCSDPECKAKIPEPAVTCPGCGGTVAGRIDNPDQRLEAEERLGMGSSPHDSR